MALRLNPGGPHPGASQPHGYADRARTRLCAGDVAGYRVLHEEASRIEDSGSRYQAVRELVEGGFAASNGMDLAPLSRTLLAVVEGALASLEHEPREPVLLNYLGVALYELGASRPAETLFKAALRLDPELPNVERNLEAAGRKRALPALPKHVQVALPALGERAERCADRARPAEGLTLSLCMIVKDEEEMLPRCLEAAKPAVDEIVVVDTGSSDRTVEIARSFGAKVIEHPWTGDFAEARNVSVDACSGDWFMWLDADEVLVAEDQERLRALTGKVWREAFFLVETNFTGDLGDGNAATHNALRVVRNRPEHRFEGRVHEQVAQALPSIPERLEATRVRVEHYGYLGAVRDSKGKSRRNIELLERQAADGVSDPFHHFNLGSEYAVAGDVEAAARQFERAWDAIRADGTVRRLGFVPSLVNRLVKARRVIGDRDGAESLANEGLELFPGYTDLVLEQAQMACEAGDPERAVSLLEYCLKLGDAPSHYSPMVGAGTYVALCELADVHRARGDLPKAECLLERCLRDHPRYLGAVLPLAEVMLARGASAREVVPAIEASVAELTPSVRFMLGTALYEAGHVTAAEDQFRAVLERQPGSAPVRLALAEALLSQRRYEQASAVARDVPESDPCVVLACRTELFASAAAGNAALAPCPERIAKAGMPRPDSELFAAWQASLAGRPLPAALPAEAAPLAAVLLEALLKVEEVDAFVSLLPVMERLALPERERRELMAHVYLRRGFLESAADEWIAASQEGPDVRALVGLAQVALARELPEEALVFAREALELDPACQGAARIATRLSRNGEKSSQVGP